MKNCKFIILFLSLFYSINALACFDEDDDWRDDDFLWGGELPEYIVTPDDDDFWSDDFWNNDDDWDEDDDWSEDDDWDEDDDWNDYYDDIGYSSYSPDSDDKNYKEYTPNVKDKSTDMELKTKWERQEKGTKTCVVTAMEYVAKILGLDIHRNFYIYEYNQYINPHRDVNKDGIAPFEIEIFINKEFYADKIFYQSELMDAINSDNPILSIIDGSSEKLTTELHEIVIIGSTEDGNYYIYIDPMDGNYKTISYFKIQGPNFRINSSKH